MHNLWALGEGGCIGYMCIFIGNLRSGLPICWMAFAKENRML